MRGMEKNPLRLTQLSTLPLRSEFDTTIATKQKRRHIDIRYFFIKDRIDKGDIKVEYLHTKSMIADYLTKPLVGELFYKLRDLLLGYTTL